MKKALCIFLAMLTLLSACGRVPLSPSGMGDALLQKGEERAEPGAPDGQETPDGQEAPEEKADADDFPRYTIRYLPEMDRSQAEADLCVGCDWLEPDEIYYSVFAVEREDTGERMTTFAVDSITEVQTGDWIGYWTACQTSAGSIFQVWCWEGSPEVFSYDAQTNTVASIPHGQYAQAGDRLVRMDYSDAAMVPAGLDIHTLNGREMLCQVSPRECGMVFGVDGDTLYYGYTEDEMNWCMGGSCAYQFWAYDLSTGEREKLPCTVDCTNVGSIEGTTVTYYNNGEDDDRSTVSHTLELPVD